VNKDIGQQVLIGTRTIGMLMIVTLSSNPLHAT
jgi:hypothetical protein